MIKRTNLLLALLVILLCFYKLNAQEIALKNQANEIIQEMETSSQKDKVMWLDSLTSIVWRKKGFNFDSLAIETIRYSIEQDTADVAAYHVVNRMYYYSGAFGDLKMAESIFEDFRINHIGKVKKPRRLSNFYKAGGLLYYNSDEYEKSLNYYNKAFLSAEKTTDSQAIGEIYMGKGMVYYNQGKLMESSKNLQKSIPYFKSSRGINAIINVKNIMTSLYSENGLYGEAEKERNETIELAKKEEHRLFLSQIYFNYSVELRKRHKLKERIEYIELAIENVEQSRYKKYYKPIYLSGMVIALSELNMVSDAQSYMELVEKEERKNAPGETTAFYKEAKMRLAFAEGKYQLALEYGKEYHDYKITIQQSEGLEQAEQFLAKVYGIIGDDKKAFQHYKNYTTIKDSITGLKKAQGLIYFQTLYETEKRDAKISEQEGELSLLDAQNKLKSQWMLFGGIGLLLVFSLIITFRSRAYAQKKQLMQQKFAHQILATQENERKTIAKELHDGIGQDLLLIKNSAITDAQKVPKLVDKTLEDIRSLSRNLHPVELEKFGITKAIINMVNEINEATEIFFSEDVENIDKSLSKEGEIYLYRIIQECVNNIIKHSEANASKISVKDKKDSIVLTIQDNGKGFHLEKAKNKSKSLGLHSLIERVDYLKGKIEFDTQPKKGTKVIITLYK